jgi:hypothetical protein
MASQYIVNNHNALSVDDEPADKEKIVQLEHHEEVPNDQEVLETKYAGTWR